MPLSVDVTEAQLVERCLCRDRQAQRLLFERYKRAMYTKAFRILNDADHAHDVLQDAFVEVFRDLPRFRFESTLGAWIKTIVLHHALRRLKAERRWETLDEQRHDHPIEPPDHFTAEELETAIRRLPDGCRAVFLLAEVEGYRHNEIAELLGISEGTAKSQLNYAKKKLRTWLTRH
ncbi:sigma-70 family RNA polymerase sigma factor [Runella sp. CRIBMP]|uniref:RNA polymerase sigma factor n=1 Tax=Runella sp. CRIBMP TaxID=2683261 RepID=UPI00141222E9|nr:sigma-70 family RNA polymerase sigma factor [Runella sp. CRIBMP]NBB22770.1 sigma-70 family RNA polymerase sigma factor [Runella sp. CRIBMP]